VAYLLLLAAIASEVAATSLLPRTHGFTSVGPSLLCALGYTASILLLARVVRTMPVGIAYAIWSAVGTAAVVAIGALVLGQPVTGWQLLGLALVVGGVLLLHLGGTAL
jgi:small multidrug resistance pump